MADITVPIKATGDSLTAAEVNTIVDGVNSKEDKGHTHDARYYTEEEVDDKFENYTNNEALSTLLAAKQNTGDYATNAALTSGLATKQATGDYATNSALTSGLATKQATGDYATNTALTTGLAGKADLVGGKVPADQLPAYVDDVVEYANLAAFPGTGSAGIIYVAQDTDLTYRWSGSTYVQISSGAVTAVNGQTGAVTITKTSVGLGSVPDVDATNPANITQSSTHRFVTDAEKTTWNAKQAALVSGTNIKTINGQSVLGSGDITISGSGGGDLTNSTVTGLRALSTADAGIRYYLTDADKEGLFYYDADDDDTVDDGILTVVSNTGGTRKCFKRFIQNNTVYLKWWTGATDYSIILKKLIEAGYHIEGEPGAVYPCTTLIKISDESVSFNGNGCRFELTYAASTAGYWIEFRSTPNTSFTVESISDMNLTSTVLANDTWTNIGLGGIHGSSYLVLDGNRTSDIAIGDVMKIYSLTEYVTGFTDVLRGEFFVVEEIAYDATSGKTRVAYQGALTHTYTISGTNVKVCSMQRHSFNMSNFTLRLMNKKVVGGIWLKGFINPTFKDVTIENIYYPALYFRSCFGYVVDGCNFRNSQNDPPGGFGPNGADQGYGICDEFSWGGRVYGSSFINVRHGWTSNAANQVAGTTTDPYEIGQTVSANVYGNTAKGCAHPFDTHQEGWNINFSDNVIDGCTIGYQIRSAATTINGGRIIRAYQGIYVRNDLSLVSAPVVIQNITIDQLHQDSQIGIKIDNAISFPVRLDNVRLYGGALQVTRAELQLNNCEVDTRLSLAGGGQINYWMTISNSDALVRNMYVKSSSGSYVGVQLTGSATITIDGIVHSATATTTPKVANGSGTGNKLFIRRQTFLGANSPVPPSTSDITSVVGGYTTFTALRIQWDGESQDVTPSTESSALIPVTSTASTINLPTRYFNNLHITEKFNSLSQNITVVNSSGVAGFDNGAEVGQVVTTINTTTFNVTLPTLNSVSKILAQNQIARRIWDGTAWRYL